MRCPVCKADNLLGPQCRRCKADLSLLFALDEQRRRTMAEARVCLRSGEWQSGVERATSANWLRDDDDSQQLLALAHLLSRDFSGAWQYYRKWRASRTADG